MNEILVMLYCVCMMVIQIILVLMLRRSIKHLYRLRFECEAKNQPAIHEPDESCAQEYSLPAERQHSTHYQNFLNLKDRLYSSKKLQ